MNNDQTGTPAIYVFKYNRFVDNIIGRVNRILSRSYDPVQVKLTNGGATKKTKSKRKKNKNAPKNASRSEPKNTIPETTVPEQTEIPSVVQQRANNKPTQKPKRKAPAPTQKPKKTKKNAPKARATLYGLSSIKRDGDVTVNLMSSHTTVKTNFALGPLTLRVEKEFGRGAKRELKSATATTAEMHGKLVLRVSNDGSAKLHSIKVLQPKQVRVDSPDEHDRTREFIWKRSSHIAHLVSQKLATATRSMLRPSAKSIASSTTTKHP